MEPTALTDYKTRVVPALKEKLGLANPHEVPRLEKIVVNCGIGREPDRKAAVEDALEEISLITGQRGVPTVAKNSISNFKLREGEAIGAKVTLRGNQMYDFFLRLVSMAIPRIRDFRGVSFKAFDGRGNYTLGVNDHTIFPEVELDKVKRNLGFDICFVTSATTNDHAKALLAEMGMPFRKVEKKTEEGQEAAA
ncbi:MAG: 50S ribosomal protein L5 [Verrucomicrobiota bacterium]